MDSTFLLTFFSEKQPRRSHVIFAILSQKTTGSTEYWGLRYQLLDWLGLLPKMNKPDFEKVVADLLKERLLYKTEPGLYALTEKGRRAKVSYQAQHYQLKQPADRYLKQTASFMLLFLLANQIVSEYAYRNRHYYPIQVSLKERQLIKSWFRQQDKNQLIDAWREGLVGFLETLPAVDADHLTQTWIGHGLTGLNFDQLQMNSQWTDFDFYLWQLDLYTRLISYIEENLHGQHPMAQLYQLVGPRAYLSDSIKASYEAAKAGQTLPEIAQHRKLKLGTVQEHLLTAAIWLPFAEFPYDSYLTPAVIDYLAQHLTDADIDQWRFNMVRTSDDITEFFLFRLYEIWQTKQEQAHEQA